MFIKDHLLYNTDGTQVDYKLTPNHGGKIKELEYLVMHYTAVTSFESTNGHFYVVPRKPESGVSAHLLIGRDGRIKQFVPFNVVAWHAGKSKYIDRSGLNQFAIGIELVNGGLLKKNSNTFNCIVGGARILTKEVLITPHKNHDKLNQKDQNRIYFENQPAAWHQYTKDQLDVAMEIATLLVKEYHLKEVIGHDDISSPRKIDPGPAFPMESFRLSVMGGKYEPHKEPVIKEPGNEFITNALSGANIRSGPGAEFLTLTTKPLPKGTKVLQLETKDNWSFVKVQEKIEGNADLKGWIASRLLKSK